MISFWNYDGGLPIKENLEKKLIKLERFEDLLVILVSTFCLKPIILAYHFWQPLKH